MDLMNGQKNCPGGGEAGREIRPTVCTQSGHT